MSTRVPRPDPAAAHPSQRFTPTPTTRARALAGPTRRSVHATPVVTVFGAGISGLSVAHELVERGFRVRVVEPAPSEDREYECEVGGLARNQFARAPLYAAQLVDDLGSAPALDGAARGAAPADEGPVQRARAHLQTLLGIAAAPATPQAGRAVPSPAAAAAARTPDATEHAARLGSGMRRAGVRHPFPERLVYTRAADAPDDDPRPAADLYQASNADKIAAVLDRLAAAWRDSRAEIVATLREIGGDGAVARFDPEHDAAHARLVLEVDVVAISAARADEGRAYAVTTAVAEQARAQLLTENRLRAEPIPQLAELLVASGLGSATANGVKQPTYLPASPVWVELRVLERLLPGEHGYRYFPSFYRNLFDVMRRTPIIDDDGRVTAETAFDQLVPAPDVGFAFRGRPDGRGGTTPGEIREFPRRRARTAAELRQHLQLTFDRMAVTERDLLFYELQLLRYATSSTARRRGYEDVSWWDFLRGRTSATERPIRDDDATDPRTAVYSERMAHWLREIPQALIAMQSSETDARTYGTIVSQLLQGDLGDGSIGDRTLNGPTSVVWLRQWKRFLKRQGVDFYVGSLTALDLAEDGTLLPRVAGPDGGSPRLEPLDRFAGTTVGTWAARRCPGHLDPFDDSDFYVLAVPVEVAARLVRGVAVAGAGAGGARGGATALRGDLARLHGFVVRGAIADPAGVRRDAFTGRPTSARYPLRDFAGVQYFFPRRIGIGEGHIYYADAEWGLSSISQLAYWRDRGGPRGAFLGQISVDIGDWYAPRVLAGGERLSALRCTPAQIARATWEQVVECLRRERTLHLTLPAFYHLDHAIERRDDEELARNATPFLLSLPRQWVDRPGLYGPAREALGAAEDEVDALEELYDDVAPQSRRARERVRHDEIRYRIAHRRWVIAGTFMATYTRLTTMEAANESGRHAVNAILRALRDAAPPAAGEEPWYNGAGQDPGDPCRIANPEEHEWPDLEPLRRLDAALHAEGLPHVLDILRVPEALDRVPHRPSSSTHPLQALARLGQLASDQLARDGQPLAGGLEALAGEAEQRLRAFLAKLYPAG